MLRNVNFAPVLRSAIASTRSNYLVVPATKLQTKLYSNNSSKDSNDSFDPSQHYEVEEAMPFVAKNVNLKKTRSLVDLFVTKLEKEGEKENKEEQFSEFEALQKSDKAKTVKAQFSKKKVREANDNIYTRDSEEAKKLQQLEKIFNQSKSETSKIYRQDVIDMETKERDSQTKAGDSLLSFMYESKSTHRVVESWEVEQQEKEQIVEDFKQHKRDYKKIIKNDGLTTEQANRSEYNKQFDAVTLQNEMLEGMPAVSDFSLSIDLDRMSASPTSLTGDKLIQVNNARNDVKSQFWNVLSNHEKRYFLKDEYLEDISKNVEKYINMSQEEIEQQAPWLLNDPRWETIEELRKQNIQDMSEQTSEDLLTQRSKYFRTRIFEDESLRNLYESLGSKQFDTIQEFYENIKEATDEDGLLRKLEIVFPNISRDKLKSILDKIVKTIQPKYEKYASPVQRTIQLITDEITETAKPTIYTMADLAAKPKPKMQTVLWSIRQIATKKAKEREVELVHERAKTLKREDYTSPIDHIYEVLRPIHDESMKAGDEKSGVSEFHPAIYGGYVVATGKRKTSIANVKLSPGTGLFLINNKSYLDYFNLSRHHYKIMLPLKFTDTLNQFDVECRVHGGGQTGQCDAIFLGLAKALTKFIPEYGPTLEATGFLYRDPRSVERKKFGQPKARKQFTFVKR